MVWEPEDERWLMRAFPLGLGPDHQVDVHFTDESEIPAVITAGINHLEGDHA